MAPPDQSLLTCFSAVADEALEIELRDYCVGAGIVLESFSHPDRLFDFMDGRAVDLIILDAVFLAESRDPWADVRVFIEETRKKRAGLPVLLMLPPAADEDFKSLVLEAGVTDFLSRPLSRAEFSARVRSLARNTVKRRNPVAATSDHEGEIRLTIGEILQREYETLSVLGKAAEYKDRETGLHITRVAHYSKLIARMIGQSAQNQEALFHASALHDIGKLGIPDAVLLKPGRLTDDEFSVMKTHSVIGHHILKHSESSYLLTGAMIALTHHEKYDGTGYPMRLKAGEIPLFGRIVCIADVFDALTTARPYKEPWPLGRAFELLARERGKQFDPTLVDAFLSNALGVEWIFHNHADVKALGPVGADTADGARLSPEY
jgi:response regulator RpfG family c-di-GMP phosphodiesterase